MWKAKQIVWAFSIVLGFNRLHLVDAHSLIVNGSSCDITNHPYFVYILILMFDKNGTSLTNLCGGSLIKPDVVLTAAHCCKSVVPNFRYVNGSTFYAYSSPIEMEPNPNFEQGRVSREYKTHPNYNHMTFIYDLCVIKFNKSFELTKRTQLVELATPELFKPILEGHKRIDLIGFGKVWSSSIGGPVFNATIRLQCAQNVVGSTDECRDFVKSTVDMYFSPSASFCTLPNITRSTACPGDSGGPVLYNGIQVGIVSYGVNGVCGPEPGFFARVDSELEFITRAFENNVHGMLLSPMLYIFIFFMYVF